MSEERTVTERTIHEVAPRRSDPPAAVRLEALVGRLATALEQSRPTERSVILGRTLQELAEAIDAHCAWLSRVEANGEAILQQEWSADPARHLPSRDVEPPALGGTWAAGQACTVVATEPSPPFDGLDVRSVLCLPLLADGRTVGCLGFAATRLPGEWDRDDVALLGLVAGRVAAVVAAEPEPEPEPTSLGRPDGGASYVLADVVESRAPMPSELSLDEFRSVVDTAPDHIWRVDLDGRFVYTNRLPKPESEQPILGRRILDLAPPEDWPRIQQAIDLAIEQQVKVTFESRDLAGRVSSTRIGPFIRDGRVVALTGVSRDITELKEVQRQQEAHAAILQQLATSAPFETVLDSITRMVDDTSPDLYCSSWWVDPRTHRLSLLAATGVADEASRCLDGCRVDVDPGPFGMAYRHDTTTLRHDLSPTDDSPAYVRALFDAGSGGCWVHPIRDQHRRVVVLLAVFTTRPRDPSQGEAEVLLSATRLARLACEHRTIEQRRRRSDSTVRALHEVTSSPHLGFDEQVSRLLAMGRESFELDVGILARVEEGSCSIVQSDATAIPELESADLLDLCAGHYLEIVSSEAPIALASTAGERCRSAVASMPQAYIGMRVLVGDEVWGTLSFSSTEPRDETFGPAELNLIQLMARWVGSELERQRSEETLHLTQLSLERTSDGGLWLDPNGRIVFVNGAACGMLNYSRDELTGLAVPDVDTNVTPASWPQLWARIRDSKRLVFESVLVRKQGSQFPAEISASYVTFRGREYVFAFVRDITDRLRTDDERKRLETMLRQSQKMEALGQLAGGVAHDFNNLLTAILGNTEMLLADDGMPESSRTALEQIGRAGERAARLTRQLLAFSRKQARELEVLELNRVVSDMESMLQRLIGENIQLETSLAPEAGKVLADAAQIEQVILNLALNARDAMTDGGRLRITTSRVVLDPEQASDHVDASPGPHVVITVVDTGKGMDHETLNHVFEPFFTTKPVGEGTGLGLSTIYGIVTQAGGHVTVKSKTGRGTMFAVFLPETDAAGGATVHHSSLEAPTGEETILVCEDEWMVRDLACKILESAGYRVLQAQDGRRAFELAARHEGRIDLLLSDTVMPEVSGAELARELSTSRPGIRVLFMSGYTSDVLARHGVDELQMELLEKPFSARKLLERVRRVLDSPARP